MILSRMYLINWEKIENSRLQTIVGRISTTILGKFWRKKIRFAISARIPEFQYIIIDEKGQER